ncbi:Bug family tripartite tricarboxylate transporter substrate binding protein [Alkalilacustris brevis]|uniref:Bug family tripartite tricarboxylate transporter substrate binding protein n=1 Tax=Alkalilacustris brevis TaxID=2026338 RepID=UPI000E0D78B4|nr:tripartite tricarboxylate transporter substrate binding protein [Alkalilacustris brevis]
MSFHKTGLTGRGMATLAATAILGFAVTGTAQAQDYPAQPLDMTVAFAPGGGNDIMSRVLADILQKYDLYTQPISINNRSGGSGAVGWGYFYNQAGSAYDVSSTSGSIITTPLQADTPWHITDFTPVALLATDDLVLAVSSDSPYTTIEEFIEGARENPPVIGGTGTVNVDFIAIALFAEKAGFEFDYVPFNSRPDSQTALLSGALDALMNSPGQVVGMVEAGEMRALAYTGGSTPAELEGVPTMASLGMDPGVSMPRGLILPPDAPQEAVDWWIETMRFVVDTPEWQQYIASNMLTEITLFGDDFNEYILNTEAAFANTLRAGGYID